MQRIIAFELKVNECIKCLECISRCQESSGAFMRLKQAELCECEWLLRALCGSA